MADLIGAPYGSISLLCSSGVRLAASLENIVFPVLVFYMPGVVFGFAFFLSKESSEFVFCFVGLPWGYTMWAWPTWW